MGRWIDRLGTTAGGVGLFFGVVFLLIGGIALFTGGGMIGSIIFGVIGLAIIWASNNHIKNHRERLQRQLDSYRQ